ncbi:hypothetical protein HOLleu_04110 [Holothuria leucospilota]|uniref:Uncharacterized protein n=1 Tax=Holothuria leucospilota TaxID=206669 RepID=A0A9Q1CTU4_HOLLE|nr:hypothetical protein HOLleu_04110 [Holothuria leucospilota]
MLCPNCNFKVSLHPYSMLNFSFRFTTVNLSHENGWHSFTSLLVVAVVLFTKDVINCEQCHCNEVVYLQARQKALIPCQSDQFQQVSWFTKQDYDGSKSPFIYFNSAENFTAGYKTAEYEIELNGSLIIKNVTLSSHRRFVAVFTFPGGTPSCKSEPIAVVIVPPVPAYAVVIGHVNQQYVQMDVERQGTLYCSMTGVHPNVNLTLVEADAFQSGTISLQLTDMTSSQNEDGTFDVSITATYRAVLSLQSSVVQCKVTGEISRYFPAVTAVKLKYPQAQPVIIGHPVYMEANRTGQLHCFKNNVSPERNLVWQVFDEVFTDRITFQSVTTRSTNKDGTVNISLASSYNVMDESIDRVTVQCILSGSGADSYEPKATVRLLFPNGNSDGCFRQPEAKIIKAVLAVLINFSCSIVVLLIGVLFMVKRTNDALQAMRLEMGNTRQGQSSTDGSREGIQDEVSL